MPGAVVTTKFGHTLQITYTGSDNDWDYKTHGDFRTSITLKSILWYPTANNDVLVINDGGNDGASILHVEASADDDNKFIKFNPPLRCKPFIDYSDCIFGTATSTKIIFHLA